MHVTCLRVCSGQLYEVDSIYEKALGAKQAGATEIICPKKNEEQLKVREWVLLSLPEEWLPTRPINGDDPMTARLMPVVPVVVVVRASHRSRG